MTNEEKLQLIEDNQGCILLDDLQAISQCSVHDASVSLLAYRFYKNNHATYFYNNFCVYNDDLGLFRFQPHWQSYVRFPNDDKEGIYWFLNEIVAIIGADNKPLWYNKEWFDQKGVSLVGCIVTKQSKLISLMRQAEKNEK
jgi:hypothetical protein